MFWHNIKYSLLTGIRNRELLTWIILFPVALGTLFKLAFGKIYEEDMTFTSIPVAIVETEGKSPMLRSVMDGLVTGDDPLFDADYVSSEEADSLLKNNSVIGIIEAGDSLSLTVSSSNIKSTIVKKFVQTYNLNARIIEDTVKEKPLMVPLVASALQQDLACISRECLSYGNTNLYDQYFYNLIAMVALFGAMGGLHIAIENQGNLSALGARKCVSPTPKTVALLSALFSSFLFQAICMVIMVSYIHFILKVDMGRRLGLFYLTSILAGFVGCSMGFAIGSISRAGLTLKNSLVTGLSLLLCFFSGLMDGRMKQLMAENLPWFNKLNPAAVISESLFCLNIYEDYERYSQGVITLIIMTLVLAAVGMICTRRRKYASL